jgi:hypothetical protein
MVRILLYFRPYDENARHQFADLRCLAGPTCWIRHAFGRYRDLPLLHGVDSPDGICFFTLATLSKYR